MCTCQCCTPACVRVYVSVLHAYMRACLACVHVYVRVRLHVSRLTFSSLVIRFSSRWIRNQGPPIYHQTPPPEPPATTGRTASPRRPQPARAATPPRPPRNHSPPPVCRRTGHPSRPPAPSFFSGDPHPTAQSTRPPPPATANQRSHDFEYPPTTNLLPFLSFIYALTGGPYGNVRC